MRFLFNSFESIDFKFSVRLLAYVTLFIFLIFPLVNRAQSLSWAKSNSGTEYLSNIFLLRDAKNQLLNFGFYYGIADFDPGTGSLLLTSKGENDIFFQRLTEQGNLVSLISIGGTGSDAPRGVCLNIDGGWSMVGSFSDSMDIDPGVQEKFVRVGNSSFPGVFILRMDSNDNFLWGSAISSSDVIQANAITNDLLGNHYIAGIVKGSCDFDPGPGEVIIHADPLNFEMFLLKLDYNGNFKWVRKFDGTGNGYANDVIFKNGNLYITGSFENSLDIDPDSTQTHLLNVSGFWDGFLVALDSNGNLVNGFQLRDIGGNFGDEITPFRLIESNDSSIFLGGDFIGTYDFDFSTGTDIRSGFYDIFILKFSEKLVFEWVKTFGSVMGYEHVNDLYYSESHKLYVTGFFAHSMDIDPGPSEVIVTSNGQDDTFIQILSSSGNLLNYMTFGGIGRDFGSASVVDDSSNLFSVGVFQNTVDFDPGSGAKNLTSAGLSDGYILKLWEKPLGIETLTEDIHVKLFPNPVGSLMNLHFNHLFSEVVLDVLDMQGRVLYTTIVYDAQSTHDISFLNRGMYLIRLNSDRELKSYKIFKN